MSEESVEERLARIENLLKQLMERLERLESALSTSAEGKVALEIAKLAVALAIPPTEAALATARIVEASRKVGERDEVSIAVIEALSNCEPATITELERRVRKLRGKASKHTIRKRLEALLRRGIVVSIDRGSKKLYTLKQCIEG